MPANVIDLLEAVEPEHEQCEVGRPPLRRRDQTDEARMQHAAVRKTRQRIMFGEMPDALGLALAQRDVAQDRSILKAVRSLPAREARLDGNVSPFLRRPSNSTTTAPPGTSSAWRAASCMGGLTSPSPGTAHSVPNRATDYFGSVEASPRTALLRPLLTDLPKFNPVTCS